MHITRRVAKIWKRGGGGYFKKVRKVQTTLSEFSLFLNQFHTVCLKIQTKFLGKLGKFEGFFRPKSGGLQKKKKKRSSSKLRLIFRPKSEIQRFFPPKIRWSPKKKIKKVFAEIETDFSAEIRNSNV